MKREKQEIVNSEQGRKSTGDQVTETMKKDTPRYVGVLAFFLLIGYAVYDLCHDKLVKLQGTEDLPTPAGYGTVTDGQVRVYPLVFAFVIAALAALWLMKQIGLIKSSGNEKDAYTKAYFPVFTGLLAFVCMVLCYSYLGVWPVGTKSIMTVDMHHQYAPLLAQMKDTILHGESLLYNFDLGMGASYLPLIGYYCASPLNIIVLFFPDSQLTEAILVITLIKNALIAAFFAMALQYIYQRRSYMISAVSIMFSMSMYMIAYSWNIMWLDVIMVLPLVVMGFEQMMREKKFVLYTLSLAYALFVNYYIAFMLCVFMVLYYIVFLIREKHEPLEVATSFLRFGGFSVLAAALASLLLIPVAMSLGSTSAAGGGFNDQWAANFDAFDLLGRHLYDVSPTIRSGNLPNIYSGVLVLLAVPLYAANKEISGRRRGAMLGLLGLLAISLCVNNMDLFWHGLHAPNDLPYRFSFLYGFVLLLITYEVLIHMDGIRPKSIGASIVGIAAYLILEEKFGDDAYDFKTLYLSLAIVLAYALIILLISQKKMLKEAGAVLLLVIVVAEMVTSTDKTFIKLSEHETFTEHANYVDNKETRAIRQGVKIIEEYGDAATNEGFYRMDILPCRTCADTAMFDYSGMTIFASSNSYETTRFMGGMGYAVNGVNSYLYHSFAPVADSLLGLRYVAIDTTKYEVPPTLIKCALPEKYKGDVFASSNYEIYENPDALSVAYFVDDNVKNWKYEYYNAYNSNVKLMKALTGSQENVYECMPVKKQGDESAASSSAISFDGASGAATYNVSVTQPGQMYFFVDCRAARSISITADSANGSTGRFSSWTISANEPNTVYAGQVQKGDKFNVTLFADGYCTGAVYAMVLNEDVYKRQMETLHANEMEIKSFSDTKVTGTLTAPRDGMVMTSIPYDKGWTVKVDGKKVKTQLSGDERVPMLVFEVSQGKHEITMTFMPTGLIPGIVVFLLGVAVFVLLVILQKHPEKMEKAKKKLRKTVKKLSSSNANQRDEGALISDTLVPPAMPVNPVPPMAPVPPAMPVNPAQPMAPMPPVRPVPPTMPSASPQALNPNAAPAKRRNQNPPTGR